MFCTHCGLSLPDTANFCAGCGTQTIKSQPPVRAEPRTPPARPAAGHAEPAGLGTRLSAALLDGGIGIALMMACAGIVTSASIESTVAVSAFGVATPVWWWIYSAGYISSTKQATPGMAIAGIAVTDLSGARLSFGRASARFMVKLATIVAFPSLVASMVTILRSANKQALHDLAAGSVVLSVVQPIDTPAAAPAPHVSSSHLSLLHNDNPASPAEAFPLSRTVIWMLCVFATPIVGAILYYAWRRSYPVAARYANTASFIVFGGLVLLWLVSLFVPIGGL